MKASLTKILFLACSLAWTTSSVAETTLKQAAEAEERSEAILEQKQLQDEQIRKGSTPLSTMLAIREAVEKGDLETAGSYLDLRYLPKKITDEGGASLFRKLSSVWRQQKILDFSRLSHDEKGHHDDELPSYLDLLGTLKTSEGKVPVYLQRIPDKQHGHMWKISNRTVNQIPTLWDEFGYPDWIVQFSSVLPDVQLFYMENWQLVGFVFILIVTWYLTRLLSFILVILLKTLKPNSHAFQNFAARGLRLALYFIFIGLGIKQLGLSFRAKIWLNTGILEYIAATFIILGLIELFTRIITSKSKTQDFSHAIMRPMATTAKIIAVIILTLSWLSDAGYNLTTVLTGLGIGSLAVALAAQKTLENVFGAFTLYIARPIRPGEFCKFGNVSGTVEEIGLRSTSIRKLDRTLVHVPNSIFSSKELENFAEIDRRRFYHELRVQLDTSPEQLKLLVIEIRKLLHSHNEILEEGTRVRFKTIERDAFMVMISAYFNTPDILKFEALSEDLNFHLLTILEKLDIQLARNEQKVLLTRDQNEHDTAKQQATEQLQKMIEAEQLPFPSLSEDEKKQLRNTVQFPPKGSPQNTKE